MELSAYFENNKGLGVLATSDASGNVDAAIYARPHVIDDRTVAFIMAERTSHANLLSNPKAAYLFKEDRSGYQGTRLFLTMIKEEKNSDRIESWRRREKYDVEADEEEASRYLVYFRVDNQVPLVGKGKCPVLD